MALTDFWMTGVRMWSRMSTRTTTLCVGGVLTALFVVLGGLSAGWAVAGLMGLAAWAAIWPGGEVNTSGAADPIADGPKASGTGESASATNDSSPLWRQVFDAMPDAALMLDGRLRVLAANAQAAALFPAPVGRTIVQLHRSPELLAAVDQAAGTGAAQTFDVYVSVPVERHLSGVATPLGPRATGGDTGASRPAVLLVLRDRTEQDSLAQMRADFVANASHELRTPLASLKGFVETLQGAAKDDPVARENFLGIMQSQASRMSRLIEDLLSLSRVEMREHVAPTGRADLAGIVSEVARTLAPNAGEVGIALALPPPSQPVPVIGDRDELVQVVHNLLQNAIRYGRRDGRVEVSLAPHGRRVALVVADDGIGIAPEHLPRLTERFYRVSAKDSRERGGTGLGLAIVKHIVNRHQGELRIESKPGQGSTFTVLLPSGAL